MSAKAVLGRVQHTDGRSMTNHLRPAARWGGCTVRGIHGAARERAGIKRGTSAARRRHDKDVIRRWEREE